MKKKIIKNPRVPRTRNANSMTESSFWSMIRSCLRQKSRWWIPIAKCKENARRPYKGVNKRQKWEYQCNKCKQWFPDKFVNIDHIIPAGELNCSADLEGFVNRLFIEVEGLQCLCSNCHSEKTKLENNLKPTK
jgi:5-methylcytosine-specific restriction endonuclease McrA